MNQRRSPILFLAALVVCAGLWLSENGWPAQWPQRFPASASTAAQEEDPWYLLLVNPWHTMPEGYKPELTQLDNGQSVDSRIYPSLQAMFDAARAEGVDPRVGSGYRTADTQQRLLDQEIQSFLDQGFSNKEAKAQALTWVAKPGTSEHQLGLAVDVYAVGNNENQPVLDWLAAHCQEYGFILRYPADKTELTGIQYEPWHFRYVGEEAAAAITANGQCLEEYLGQIE